MHKPILSLLLSIQTALTAKYPVFVHFGSACLELEKVLVLTMSSFGLSNKNVSVCLSPHKCYMPHPTHLLDLIVLILCGEKYNIWSSSPCTFLQQSAVISSLLSPNILISTLFSDTLICVLYLTQEIEYHIHIKQINYNFIKFPYPQSDILL